MVAWFRNRLVLLLLLTGILVFCHNKPASANNFTLELSTGYRVDSLDWNIAADFVGSTPNILSELQWNDLESYEVGARAEISRTVKEEIDVVFLGRSAYGLIISGDNQDSDYAGDNRTLEWSRSNNDAGDGHVLDFSGAAGLRFYLKDKSWAVTPLIGYSYYEQDLVMRNGYQTLSDPVIATANGFPNPPPVGPIIGLNSSYYAWWYGPSIGLEVAHRLNPKLSWDVTTRWHEIDFGAEADWNLRTDLKHPVSFEHEANGDGISLDLGVAYTVQQQWDIAVDYRYIDLQAKDGLDIVYLNSGLVGGTRLNEVNWESWSLSVSLQHRF